MTSKAGTMNFFEHQDNARRKTSVLVFYYILAVILIMATVYLAFAVTFIGFQAKTGGTIDYSKLWHAELFVWVLGGTFLVVAMGSLYKIGQLAQGGKSIAEMMGGRLINSTTRNPDERKVLNVVEEMAIASGMPVPPVYIMENERGINAFAAGFSHDDAVVAVTRGCVEQLSRDELQGVIAHEFSHIFNGDMRLNIRLMGILHGILVIAMLGYWIMRLNMYSSGRSREKGGTIAIVFLGFLLMIIGYIGVFFGKLIKSAVSRQREFLADASAVQFTRNPNGISGALKKIGGFSAGSRLKTTHAEEASHFFFSNGLRNSLFGMMSTHPPLTERIQRIDPSFQGDFKSGGGAAGAPAAAGAAGFAGGGEEKCFVIDPDAVVDSIGAPQPEHIDYAASIIASIPTHIAETAREPYGARAVIYCLLLNTDETPRKYQLERLERHADTAVHRETLKIMSGVEKVPDEARLALVDIALNSLKQLSRSQYLDFKANLDHLIKADEQIDLFEYTLLKIIERRLRPIFENARPPVIQYYDIAGVQSAAVQLLSCIAHWGADNETDAKKAFKKGINILKLSSPASLLPKQECGLQTVDDALAKLLQSSPGIQERMLRACAACVGADGKVTLEEAELLRAVSDSLGCPIPPFLPSQEFKKAA